LPRVQISLADRNIILQTTFSPSHVSPIDDHQNSLKELSKTAHRFISSVPREKRNWNIRKQYLLFFILDNRQFHHLRPLTKKFSLGWMSLGRSAQSLPNPRIKKGYNVHPSKKLGSCNNPKYNALFADTPFLHCLQFSSFRFSFFFHLPSSFLSLVPTLNSDQYSLRRYHDNSNHHPHLTLMELLPFVCSAIPL
jgi:hypothetical protein